MLTEHEKQCIRKMCEVEKTVTPGDCFIGSCCLMASSAFLLGSLGHSGFRKRWSSETRIKKAKQAKVYARTYAASLVSK